MQAEAPPTSILARRALDLPVPRTTEQGQAGTSVGINLEPGFNDDGWIVPDPVKLSDGTTLQLFKDGEALHAAYAAIEHARKRICLEVYIFRSDPTGRAFADLLAAKARDGVAVYLICDALGCLDSNLAMFEKLRCAGVRIGIFHPVRPWRCRFSWRPANRDHRKLLIIDDDIAGLGGLNVGGEYAGSWVVRSQPACAAWRDNAVGLRGPSARLLLIPFARVWRYVENGGRLGQAEFLHNLDEGEFGILATVPTRRSPLVPLKHLLERARKSILLTMSYFAPPDELIEELCKAARRGVRVRLMLPGHCDVKLLLTAARSFYETLLAAGVEVYERQGAVLHAKTLCIDGQIAMIGSTNLDYRSIEYNCELSVMLRNRQFAQQIHALFEHDVHFAKRIVLGEWRHRPLRDRVIQWAVRRARYLL